MSIDEKCPPSPLCEDGNGDIIYTPLQRPDSIRLLVIGHGAEDARLNLSMIDMSLATKIPYLALSYAWEGDRKTKEVLVGDARVSITSTVDSAILYIRELLDHFPGESIGLWIDAICINQKDNKEKGLQVRLMADIYRDSKQVLVYLGHETVLNEEGLAMIARIQKTSEIVSEAKLDVIASQQLFEHMGLIDPLTPGWCNLRAFFSQPWFRRSWVVQEFVVASKIRMISGKWQLEWQSFVDALNILGRVRIDYYFHHLNDADISKTGVLSFLRMTKARAEHQAGSELFFVPVVTGFCSNEATLAVDHLFAFLGIASDAGDPILDPNYDELPESVATRFALHFLTKFPENAWSVLAFAGLTPNLPLLPSWVPSRWISWQPDLHGQSLSQSSPVEKPLYYASGGRKLSMEYNTKDELLLLRGSHVDSILKIGPNFPTYTMADSVQQARLLHSFFKLCKDMLLPLGTYPTGEPLLDVIWRSSIANATTNNQEPPQEFSFFFETFVTHLENVGSGQVNAMAAKLFTMIANTLEGAKFVTQLTVTGTLTTNQIATTANGYFGQVPKLAQEGDLIFIVNGLPVPYVFRKSDTRSGAYRLIGETYVHGIMKGEALASGNFSEIEIQVH